MTDKEKSFEIDCIMCDIEMAQLKAKVIVDTLNEYFDELKDAYIIAYHEKAGLQLQVVNDYVIEIGKLMEKYTKMLKGDANGQD